VTIIWTQKLIFGFQLLTQTILMIICLLKQWLKVILLKRKAEIQYLGTEVSVT